MARTQTTQGFTVDITLNLPDDKPTGKLADAELHFTDGPLLGLKLVGFAV